MSRKSGYRFSGKDMRKCKNIVGRELAKMRADVDGRATMGERGAPRRGSRGIMTTPTLATVAIATFALAVLAAPAAPAQTLGSEHRAGPSPLTAYAQANTRSRTRIRVSPRCFYRTQATDYPVPYECEAPGPGYVRECNAALVQEYRPSGTVVVPRMQCWWVRG
jgi:hypothetical protein